MSQLFNRNVIVEIAQNNSVLVTIPTDFKIEFSIEKMINSNAATGTVTIYNLSDETKETIRESGNRVRIFAGYGSDTDAIPLLHDGDILRTLQVNENFDRKTVLYFGSQIYTTNAAIFSKSYSNDVTLRQIVSDAIPTFNLTFSQDAINQIPDTIVFFSFSYHGRTYDLLNRLLQPLNFQWFEDNGEIKISQVEKADSTETVYVLNSNTGLIKTAVQTDRGVNATSLLNSQLKPGAIVKIESDVVTNSSFSINNVQKQSQNTEGFYKIIQTTYEGDNWDGKFEAMIQCVPYGADSDVSG